MMSNNGGAANHVGVGYQDRVAAWISVQALAEQEAEPLWGWPAATTLEFVHCNTVQAIDDVLVGTSHQGLAYINVKHTVNASQSEDSDFADALTQFVQQFLASANQRQRAQPWERPLNLQLDRFILATSAHSSAPVTEVLPVVLQRTRTLLPGQGVNDATRGQAENEVLSKVLTHLRRA